MSGPWRLRDERARHCISEQPHAAELLAFYRQVLSSQQSVYDDKDIVGQFEYLIDAEVHVQPRMADVRIDRLGEVFENFIATLRADAPETTAEIGATLLQDDPTVVLKWFLGRTDQVQPAWHQYSRIQLEFYPRAFLQPVFTTIGERIDPKDVPANGTQCPICSEPPQLSILRDEPDAKGQRRLLCSLCSIAWRFPRITCARCMESAAEKLFRHENDANPHVTVEECASCRYYLKSIDLRKDGRAEPIVDEIATVELDLWAQERELTKIRANILGL